jgi:phage-related protein
MPKTTVLFYRDTTGTAPVVAWLRKLRRDDVRGYDKCVAKIERLREEGHDLRRPEADYLADGIHELRAKHGRTQYRIFYFFHGQHVAVLVHAILKKTRGIPPPELKRAKKRRETFQNDPQAHIHEQEED